MNQNNQRENRINKSTFPSSNQTRKPRRIYSDARWRSHHLDIIASLHACICICTASEKDPLGRRRGAPLLVQRLGVRHRAPLLLASASAHRRVQQLRPEAPRLPPPLPHPPHHARHLVAVQQHPLVPHQKRQPPAAAAAGRHHLPVEPRRPRAAGPWRGRRRSVAGRLTRRRAAGRRLLLLAAHDGRQRRRRRRRGGRQVGQALPQAGRADPRAAAAAAATLPVPPAPRTLRRLVLPPHRHAKNPRMPIDLPPARSSIIIGSSARAAARRRRCVGAGAHIRGWLGSRARGASRMLHLHASCGGIAMRSGVVVSLDFFPRCARASAGLAAWLRSRCRCGVERELAGSGLAACACVRGRAVSRFRRKPIENWSILGRWILNNRVDVHLLSACQLNDYKNFLKKLQDRLIYNISLHKHTT